MTNQGQVRRSSLYIDLDERERGETALFGAEAEAQRPAAYVPPPSNRSEIGHFFRDVGPWFIGIFSFLVSYGLLLTFGLLAILSLGIGFATIPSLGDTLYPAQPTVDYSSIFATSVPVPNTTSGKASATAAASQTATAKQYATPAATTKTASPWNTARLAIRIIVFGAAFLALWPGWLGASVAKAHFERTR